MHRDTVLQVVDGLEVILAGAGATTVARPGGRPFDCGPHGLAILDAFRQPRRVQDAIDRLVAQAGSVANAAEMIGVVIRLCDADLLVSPDAAAHQPRSVTGFAAAASHIAMLDDRARTTSFVQAIAATVTPGDVVIDLGTGTGVLAIAAARAGARRVYAIEATGIADTAAAMFAASGVGDRISLIRGWSTDITLDEPADVLVTETLGDDPWGENFLHLVADARRRLLRPGAQIVPSRVRRLATPVAVPASRQRRLRFTAEAARLWTDWYGIDFSPLAAREDRTGATRLERHEARDWPRPCPAITVSDVDARVESSAPRTGEGRAIVTHTGVVDGVILHWQADLAPGLTVSTDPGAADAATSWLTQLVLAPASQPVRAGETLAVSVAFDHPPRLEIAIAAHASGVTN